MRRRAILAIDGGGVRGIVPAIILTELVKRLRAVGKEEYLHRYFDLIVGTSAGGIVASSLCTPKPGDPNASIFTPDEIVRFFHNESKKIFPQSFAQRIKNTLVLIDEKYDAQPLELILDEFLKDAKLSESLTNIVLTAYDLEKRLPVFMTNIIDKSGIFRDFLVKDAVRATTAAPTFFEPARIRCASDGAYFSLVDGGVFMNDPAVAAIYHANLLGYDLKNALIVSLGTGTETRPYMYHDVKSWGVLRWVSPSRGIPLLSIIMSGQATASQTMLEKALNQGNRKKRYIKIDAPLHPGNDDLDDSSEENLRELEVFAEGLKDKFTADLDYIVSQLVPRGELGTRRNID